ncbi:uncharacterized protein BCR38DRAFT_165841 [Pseudomassariella vexata]|uniref:Uncharacterized protein n=1 Tax=Pseudomassariella vexata TaxID=1141098 RepID=A0A1Y2E2M2_9PEZI|nr:uncharacterized protein BCR38DRAFT_165841 [Pseudomassariella vexata]ORY65782.1 hypothetical protein BCR38DRAFT_165841 [Pseudomassariella vexata]
MMDRHQRKTSDVLSTRPNGQGSFMQPTVASRGLSRKTQTESSKENVALEGKGITSLESSGTSSRRSLPRPESPFSRPHSRYNSLGASQDLGSPRNVHIPRPKSTALSTTASGRRSSFKYTPSPNNNPLHRRQPMGLKDAFRLAEEQEADDQQDDTIDIQQAFTMANAEANRAIDGSPSPAPRPYRSRKESEDGGRPTRPFAQRKDSDLGQQLKQFDRNHQLTGGGGPLNGLFSKNRVGPKIAETGTTLARKASDGSLGGSPEHRRMSQWEPNLEKHSSEDAPDWDHIGRTSPLPSLDFDPLAPHRGSPMGRPTHPSPEKSYNWQLDADFTAGDLQFSDSPRIKLGRTNGGGAESSSQASSSPDYRRSNDKLDRIRQSEDAAAKANLLDQDAIAKRNTRLDEIRVQEMEALSRRAVATSRLDEIRAKNSEARSVSPEVERFPDKETFRVDSLSLSPERTKNGDAKTAKPTGNAERITDTPITIFRNSKNEKEDKPAAGGDVKGNTGTNDKFGDRPTTSHSRDNSHDLLRRLARATSSSPSPPHQDLPPQTERSASDQALPKKQIYERDGSRPRLAQDDRRPKNPEVKGSRERLTVGFVGLRRQSSSDSVQEKRRSLVNSESDPTDRIEAEMKLFAPQDNYSERGSIRAPSPDPSESSEPAELLKDETPRPNKVVDPLTQPTPRVTGAYVETPATVKIERRDDTDDEVPKAKPLRVPETTLGVTSTEPSIKRERSEVPDLGKSSARSLSAPASRSARAASRRRRPVINTANPPSVKDDLRSILRQHQIDDSTLDDFDELLDNNDLDHEELEKVVNDTVLKIEEDLDMPGLTDRERELRTYDRMSKTLKTGLLGIRSAKQGIERLEGKVAHSEHKASSQVLADLGLTSSSMSTHARDPAFLISLPRLYRRKPNFKLTLFGILTFVLAIWYTLESGFCFLYVSPVYGCTHDDPCDWSPNEPYFPYAMPFMLDEWATGGKGRALAWWVGEELGDVMAEASDWITGHDFTKEEEMYMNIWERKRHRRRLKRKGLMQKWEEPIEFREKFKSWRDAWQARQTALEQGIDMWEDERMNSDERL